LGDFISGFLHCRRNSRAHPFAEARESAPDAVRDGVCRELRHTADDTSYYTGRNPLAWRLQGSNDGKNWIDLDVDSDNNGYINDKTENPIRADAEEAMEESVGKPITYFGNATDVHNDYAYVPINVNLQTTDSPLLSSDASNIRVSFSYTKDNLEIYRVIGDDDSIIESNVKKPFSEYLQLGADNKFYVRAINAEPDTGFANGFDKIHVIVWDGDVEIHRDTVCFDVQDGSDAGGWIVPSGWRIGEDGSLTTPTPEEGAVGPKSEGSEVTKNNGAAYYELTSEQIAAGFEMRFTYTFTRNGDDGYLQPDTNKDQTSAGDASKLSFVGNSGVKFGTAYTNVPKEDNLNETEPTHVTEIAILDVEKSTALAGGLESFIACIADNTGATGLLLKGYADEPVTKLTSGVKYGAPSGALLTEGYQAFFRKNHQLFARQSVDMKLRYTGVNNDADDDKLIVYVKNQDGIYEQYGEYADVFGDVLGRVKENRVYLQAHWGSGVKFSNIEFSGLADE